MIVMGSMDMDRSLQTVTLQNQLFSFFSALLYVITVQVFYPIADVKDLIFHRNVLFLELNLLSDEVSLNDMLSETSE